MPQASNNDQMNGELFDVVDEEQLDEDIDLDSYKLDYPEVPFEHSLEIIQEDALAPQDLLGFSNMTRKQVHQLRAIWSEIEEEKRVTIAEVALMVAREHTFSDFGRFFFAILGDDSVDVRLNAATGAALSEVPELIKPLTEMAESDENVDVREAAIQSLAPHVVAIEMGLITDNKDLDRLMKLKSWTVDESQPVAIRAAALYAYSNNTMDDDVDAIIESFVEHEDDTMQLGAMRAMSVYGAGRFTRFLERQLQSNDVDAREAAANAMAESGDEAVIPMLTMAARTDTESIVREAAYVALANIATEPALESLIELRKHASEDDADVIDVAIQYISELNDLEAEIQELEAQAAEDAGY